MKKLIYILTAIVAGCVAEAGMMGTSAPGVANEKPSEFGLCTTQSSVANCHTFTNLGAAFTEVPNSATHNKINFAPFREFRLVIFFGVGAVTGDVRIDCDADAAFGSPATLITFDNPAIGLNVSAWTTIPANECGGDVFVRGGMLNGDTVEDPQWGNSRIQVR